MSYPNELPRRSNKSFYVQSKGSASNLSNDDYIFEKDNRIYRRVSQRKNSYYANDHLDIPTKGHKSDHANNLSKSATPEASVSLPTLVGKLSNNEADNLKTQSKELQPIQQITSVFPSKSADSNSADNCTNIRNVTNQLMTLSALIRNSDKFTNNGAQSKALSNAHVETTTDKMLNNQTMARKVVLNSECPNKGAISPPNEIPICVGKVKDNNTKTSSHFTTDIIPPGKTKNLAPPTGSGHTQKLAKTILAKSTVTTIKTDTISDLQPIDRPYAVADVSVRSTASSKSVISVKSPCAKKPGKQVILQTALGSEGSEGDWFAQTRNMNDQQLLEEVVRRKAKVKEMSKKRIHNLSQESKLFFLSVTAEEGVDEDDPIYVAADDKWRQMIAESENEMPYEEELLDNTDNEMTSRRGDGTKRRILVIHWTNKGRAQHVIKRLSPSTFRALATRFHPVITLSESVKHSSNAINAKDANRLNDPHQKDAHPATSLQSFFSEKNWKRLLVPNRRQRIAKGSSTALRLKDSKQGLARANSANIATKPKEVTQIAAPKPQPVKTASNSASDKSASIYETVRAFWTGPDSSD